MISSPKSGTKSTKDENPETPKTNVMKLTSGKENVCFLFTLNFELQYEIFKYIFVRELFLWESLLFVNSRFFVLLH